jgi:ParB-like chromosome segregation protein Spo0J
LVPGHDLRQLPQPAGKGNQEPRPPWQVLPALSEGEFSELKADIAQRGIAVPVVVDADSGLIVDGQHRVRAWEELRSEGRQLPDYPRDVRRFGSDAERLSFSVTANLFRRHLSRTQRAEVVARLREMGWSLRRVSEVLGVHHETVRRDLETSQMRQSPSGSSVRAAELTPAGARGRCHQ